MSEYTPDKWQIIKIAREDHEDVFKVLGTWYGGYLDGDSWRMNSGISEIKEYEKHYDVLGYSGSVYHCGKGSEGMNMYTAGIFSGFVKTADDVEGLEITKSSIEEYNDNL